MIHIFFEIDLWCDTFAGVYGQQPAGEKGCWPGRNEALQSTTTQEILLSGWCDCQN